MTDLDAYAETASALMESKLPETPPADLRGESWELRTVAERLSLIAQSVPWDLPQVDGRPLQGEALRAWAAERHDLIARHTTELGLALWMVKRELGQGAYLGWLQEAGIPQRTGQDALQLARLMFGAPDAAVPVLASLPKRKLQALAPGGQQLIEALTQDGTLAEVAEMTREEIRILARERAETAVLRERAEKLRAERDGARGEIDRLTGRRPPDRQTEGARLRALEEAARILMSAEALDEALHALRARGTDADPVGVDAAASALLHALQGVWALTGRALADTYDLLEHLRAGERMPAPILTEEESEQSRAWASAFQDEMARRLGRLL